MFSGQVGIIGHLKIADGTIIAAQSGISKDTKPGEAYMGSLAFEVQKYRKSYIHFRNLDKLVERGRSWRRRTEPRRRDDARIFAGVGA